MATPASASPRLSFDGVDVVAGDRTLVLNKTVEIGPGTSGQFAAKGEIFYTRQFDGVFTLWKDGTSTPVKNGTLGFNAFSVGGPGRYAGWSTQPDRVIFDNGTTVHGWSGPALSEDPTVWAACEHATGRLITHAGTPSRFANSDCRHPRFCGKALAWNVYVDGKWQIAGIRQSGLEPQLLNVEVEEFWPVPFLVNGELWLLTVGHTRLLLRPWGSSKGYSLLGGKEPDAKALPSGHIRVVSDRGNNILGDDTIAPTSPREELSAPRIPIEDTSGQPIDLWEYFIPKPGAFPRTSNRPDNHGHDMHVVFDGRNLWTLPFGQPGHWVRSVIADGKMEFREDHSKDGQSTGDYSFTKALWARQFMRVGDRIVNGENNLVRYAATSCAIERVHPFPFTTGLWKHFFSFDCGGSLGWQDVIVYLYDPGGNADIYELSYFAKGYGFFRWEEYNQRTDQLNHWTEFNIFGGPAPQPTPGCWQPSHLTLLPDDDVQIKAPGVQITHFDSVIRPGQPWRVMFQDRNNPGFGGVVEIVNGSVHVTMANPVDSNRSGIPRPVSVVP